LALAVRAKAHEKKKLLRGDKQPRHSPEGTHIMAIYVTSVYVVTIGTVPESEHLAHLDDGKRKLPA